jgi:hypothetical protein
MDNYIGPINAEWVDPSVEFPPDDKIVPVRMRDGLLYEGYYNRRGLGLWSSSDAEYEIFPIAWLRIGGPSTANDQLRAALSRIHDEEMGDSIEDPLRCHDAVNRFITRVQGIVCADLGCHSRDAIPREAVQVAVDEMTVRYWEGAECILHEVGERDHCEGCALDKYPHPLCKSLACIMHETGVTPTEVRKALMEAGPERHKELEQ